MGDANQVVICKNCGFHNTAGDEFCGNCGQFLEWNSVKATDSAAAAGTGQPDTGAAAPVPPPPVSGSTTPMAVPPPPPAPMPGMSPPPPPPQTAGGASPQFGGRGPDIICWNCGRRNPGGRTFCIQCGERLSAGKQTGAVRAAGVAPTGPALAGAGGGGAMAGGPPPSGGGGLNFKLIGIGAGVIIALLVIAVVAASFLGGTAAPNGSPTPTPTAGAQITPTLPASASPTDTASAPATASASPSGGLPTDTPTVNPTATASAGTTPAPTAPPTPKPTPKPTAQPTTPPTNAVCTNPPRGTFTSTIGNGGTKTLGPHTAWCLRKVVFNKGSDSAPHMKVYLINSAFSPDKYGWAEVNPTDWTGNTFVWMLGTIALPFGYDNVPPNTGVSLVIDGCTACNGSVSITYTPVSIP